MRSREELWRIAVAALRFDRPQPAALANLSEAEWQALLAMADQARLTLPLGIRCREFLAPDARDRIDRNLADNARRHSRAILVHAELVHSLAERGIPFVFLKGLTHFPHFCEAPDHRQQYDMDVYAPPESVQRIRDAAIELGYETVERGGAFSTDHLPLMVRKTDWRWRGDFYDPEMPLHLEIHFRFWDADTESFAVSGADEFWSRRTTRLIGGLRLPALHLQDTFRYASWHLVRHLLRGDLCAGHLYEFAHFLENTAGDDLFWRGWPKQPMLAEALAARLALECFGCRMHPAVESLLDTLPAPIQKWFALFAFSPLASVARPNKDELLLHFLIAPGRRERLRIAARRLFPPLPCRYIRDPHTGAAPRRMDQPALLVRRARHHLRTLLALAGSAARWFFSRPLPDATPGSRARRFAGRTTAPANHKSRA